MKTSAIGTPLNVGNGPASGSTSLSGLAAEAVPQLIAATADVAPEHVGSLEKVRAFSVPLLTGEFVGQFGLLARPVLTRPAVLAVEFVLQSGNSPE